MSRTKTLDLKVTVSGEDPDGTLAAMTRAGANPVRLSSGGYTLKVTNLERADGQPFGLEAAFEEYWRETHCEGYDDTAPEKTEARDAFLYGVNYGKEHG
jgi:hypothetical protein